ncbi:hypothetical protein QE152_g13281 [Popillia japonica]|uniref:Uncharacterized protein n=1 Tax=Popillia japonica TaxID=7064 RepID=A0AAW1LBN0_POPJA
MLWDERIPNAVGEFDADSGRELRASTGLVRSVPKPNGMQSLVNPSSSGSCCRHHLHTVVFVGVTGVRRLDAGKKRVAALRDSGPTTPDSALLLFSYCFGMLLMRKIC